jgi:hypothetical protein
VPSEHCEHANGPTIGLPPPAIDASSKQEPVLGALGMLGDQLVENLGEHSQVQDAAQLIRGPAGVPCRCNSGRAEHPGCEFGRVACPLDRKPRAMELANVLRRLGGQACGLGDGVIERTLYGRSAQDDTVDEFRDILADASRFPALGDAGQPPTRLAATTREPLKSLPRRRFEASFSIHGDPLEESGGHITITPTPGTGADPLECREDPPRSIGPGPPLADGPPNEQFQPPRADAERVNILGILLCRHGPFEQFMGAIGQEEPDVVEPKYSTIANGASAAGPRGS